MTDIKVHSEGGSAESQGGEPMAKEAMPSEVTPRAQRLSEKGLEASNRGLHGSDLRSNVRGEHCRVTLKILNFPARATGTIEGFETGDRYNDLLSERSVWPCEGLESARRVLQQTYEIQGSLDRVIA